MSSSGEGAGGQHLNLLGVADFGVGVDHFLLGFEELLSELSELKDFSFNERVPQSSYCSVDELLVWLSVLKNALTKRVKWRLSAISRLSSQFDGKDGMSLSHSEEGSGTRVVQYKLHVLGLAAIVIGIAYGCRNAELSVRPVLYEGWTRVSKSWGTIYNVLIHATYYNRR